ncbi:MAG: hypothetical protein ABGX10_03820 [Paracoccus sp. (in: a-proteobacteria)]|uniref:hypothetical protein n=1 Tax=unclassified Paracoccus (in: a-proteobacteria) TaxID=2688777 RepID=UPI000A576F58|nr:hypothetical protein [Paracoccus sp. SM22M-07]
MSRPFFQSAIGITALMIGLSGPVLAQDNPGKPSAVSSEATNDSAEPACTDESGQAEPATSPAPSEDGTAPENTGTTGWSGGTGGSQLGTNTQGAVERSPTWQPPTARGLDLKGQPEDTQTC